MFKFLNKLVNEFAQYDLMVLETTQTLANLEAQLQSCAQARYQFLPHELEKCQSVLIPTVRTSLNKLRSIVSTTPNTESLPKVFRTWHLRKVIHRIERLDNLLDNLQKSIFFDLRQIA